MEEVGDTTSRHGDGKRGEIVALRGSGQLRGRGLGKWGCAALPAETLQQTSMNMRDL